MEKSKKYLIMGIVITLVLAIIGISYAYWSGSIVGIGKDMNVSIDLGGADVIFTDNQEISDDNVMPGWEVSKSFSIENKSDETFYYDIYIKDLKNTLVTEDFLQYRITSSNGYDMGEEYDVLVKSETPIDYDLATSISIPSKAKQEYIIYIRYYNSPDVDQSADMGKTFSGRLMIRESENNDVLISYTVNGKKTNESYANLVSSKTVNSVICTNNTIGKWDYVKKEINLSNINLPTGCTVDFADGTLYSLLAKYPTVKTRSTSSIESETTGIGFNNTIGGTERDASLDTTGVIYKESTYKEEGNDVYYFAGNPTDNWVKFGKEGENDIYWRIIRTNEDGSVRLLYAGTSPDTTSGYINAKTYTYSVDSSTYKNTMYVGWTYGTSGSLSNNRNGNNEGAAKAALDTWYQNNLKTNYGKYIEDNAIYCNDRSGDGWGTSTMFYAAYKRLIDNKRPTYRCGGQPTTNNTNTLYSDASDEDKFTVKTAIVGNKKLKNPVGLMTADEVAFAGGKYSSNAPNAYYYLNSAGENVTGSTIWWTMSPTYYGNDSYGGAHVFYVGGSEYPGKLNYSYIKNSYGVRPVVSLKSSVLISGGNGTSSDPYTIKEVTD